VIVLSKADLCDDVLGHVNAVSGVAPAASIHPISTQMSEGLEELDQYLQPGRTVAVLGSSGVGKSTLINRLLGREAQATREVRSSDGRGRHTTTHRELFVLKSGALMVDTPGMRELQLTSAEQGLNTTFSDVETFARGCRFHDCQHQSERGCAVRRAVDEGRLAPDRLESFLKLGRELRYIEAQFDDVAAHERKHSEKIAQKAYRQIKGR
jgi:ribosome biogenesis GTPase / thiamine phosphate phosphatase